MNIKILLICNQYEVALLYKYYSVNATTRGV